MSSLPQPAGNVIIHTIKSRIANFYLLETGSGVVIVDTGFASAAPAALDKLIRLGYGPRDVRLIFLTHVHADHVGSAAQLRRATGAPIALHRADAAKARAGFHTMPSGRGLGGKLFEHAFNGLHLKMSFEPFEPDLFMDENSTLREFGLDARVLATPGHTLGSLSLVFPDGVSLIGDAMINQLRVAMPMYGEDNALACDTLRKIHALRPRLVYSGHGAPFTGEQIARYFEFKHLDPERAGV